MIIWKIFQAHCISGFKKDPINLKLFRDLQESILAQLILFNRRRSVTQVTIESSNDISSESTANFDHNYFESMKRLGPFIDNVTCYIAGFIMRKLKTNIKCNICIGCINLTDQKNDRY